MTIDINKFGGRVVAVPPVALDEDYTLAHSSNQILVNHMRKGGIDLLLFGGNANIYHFGSALYAELAEWMSDLKSGGMDVIASVGPDFGKALDQVTVLERLGIDDVMLLPMMFPSAQEGLKCGIRHIADKLGQGLIIYIKYDRMISADALAELFDDGSVRLVKYAVERDDPSIDPYLDDLIRFVGSDRIASGLGETPIHDHLGKRGLLTYTSGAVCLAPRAATALSGMYGRGEYDRAAGFSKPFLDFERARTQFGGIAVLHAAVSEMIVNMGHMLPLLSRLRNDQCETLRRVLQTIAMLEQASAKEK